MPFESVGAFGELIYIISSLKLHDIIVSNAPDDDDTPRQQFDLYFLINRFIYDTRDGAMQQQLRGDDERRRRVGKRGWGGWKIDVISARIWTTKRSTKSLQQVSSRAPCHTHSTSLFSLKIFSPPSPFHSADSNNNVGRRIVDAIIDNKAVPSHPPSSVVRRTSIQFTRFAEASYRFLIRPTKSSL